MIARTTSPRRARHPHGELRERVGNYLSLKPPKVGNSVSADSLTSEAAALSWPPAAARVGVHGVPVPFRGDRRGGPVVPTVQSVLPRP